MSPIALAADPVTLTDLRPLLGRDVLVVTASGAFEAQLLSCVRHSAWFVVGDDDVVLAFKEIVRIALR